MGEEEEEEKEREQEDGKEEVMEREEVQDLKWKMRCFDSESQFVMAVESSDWSAV